LIIIRAICVESSWNELKDSRMGRKILLISLLVFMLGACQTEPAAETASSSGGEVGPGMGMGMGGQSGMMARHQAPIPETYAGLSNPVLAYEESLARGAELYATNCASCHGDGGMGDGPAGTTLDPAAAPIAHTSQMLGDDYLFWRISEGGAMTPFNSAMPSWKTVLDEQDRWDVINYVQALGRGTVAPRSAMGGAAIDPAAEAAQRAQMLAAAVEQGVISQAEAGLFEQVHAMLEALMARGMDGMQGNMAAMQDEMLSELIREGSVTQEQADAFSDIHNRLLEAGLMQ
jgi:mono/diheme cytochrome c family protein